MKLFKFRTVSTNNITALANSNIWFSCMSDFNDPFEGTYIVNREVSKEILSTFKCKPKEEIGEEKYIKMLNDIGLKEEGLNDEALFKRIAEHDLEALIKIIHKSKISCFSYENEENNPIVSNLMWSHYSDGLRGFCLVFDFEKFQKDMHISTNKTMRPIYMKYQKKPNTLNLTDYMNSNQALATNNSDYVRDVTETIATKSNEWSYENEIRILALNNKKFHKYSPDSLIEIVLGEKMPMDKKRLIINLGCQVNKNITIKEAGLKKNSYEIEIINIKKSKYA